MPPLREPYLMAIIPRYLSAFVAHLVHFNFLWVAFTQVFDLAKENTEK